MKKNILLLLLVINACVMGNAQPYCTVKNFNLRDGLVSNTITGITQTPDQLMWISTWNGLCEYDGYRFQNLRDNTDNHRVLTTNRLLNIQPSQTGNLWCVTYDQKVFLFDRKRSEYIDIGREINERFNLNLNSSRTFPMSNGYTWLINDVSGGPAFCIRDSAYEDSKSIKVYTGKKGEQIRWVEEDDKHRQWIFSNIRIMTSDSAYVINYPYDMIKQVGNLVFFATYDGKIGILSEKNASVLPIQIPSQVKSIKQLGTIGQTMLAAATNAGIFIYNTENHKSKLIPLSGIFSNDVNVIQMLSDDIGRLWVITDNDDVILVDVKEGVSKKMECGPTAVLKQTNRSFIYEDKHHTIWVATTRGFSGYYDEEKHIFVSTPIRTTVFQPIIENYFIDQQGNMWYFGDHNLAMVNFRFNHLHHITGIQEVRSVMYDHDGDLWVGNLLGDIMIYDSDGNLKGYFGPDGHLHQQPVRFSTHIYSLSEDTSHRVWIGTKGDGLYCVEGGHHVLHYFHNGDPYSLPSDQIYDVHEDYQHRIWVGTFEKGVCLMQDGRFLHGGNELKNYPISDFHKVRRITETKDSVIIVSASNGLITFSEKFDKPSDIIFYAQKYKQGDSHSLMTSDVMQTCVYDSIIYVATVGGGVQTIDNFGLLKDQLKFKHQSVISNFGTVLNILEDNNKNLWIGCENSVNMYDPVSKQYWRYGPSLLGENTELTEAEAALDPLTGKITVATSDGFISFQPDRLKENAFIPPLAFVGVLFHGDTKMSQMPPDYYLDVPSDRRNLTIYFAALDYQDNYMIHYSYKLEGVDKDWNPIGTEHSISFNHLPHGHHQLFVRSTNSYGKWVDNTQILHIYVHPTFWETWWAKLLYALLFVLVLGVAVWIYKLRTVNSMERRLNEMKTRFFTDVSHKLRTPLTLIGGPVTQVLSTEKLGDSARMHLEMVRRNAQRMLDLVNKMLAYSKEHNMYISDENAAMQDPNAVVSVEENSHTETSTSENLSSEEGKTRLLIVEDNEDLRRFLVSILENDYSVSQATNGLEGLEKAKTESPDFILTDVMMPEMDGLQMVHLIKADPNISHIPIVILSAKASMDDRIEGLKAGVNDYITKPFSATYLKQRMENIIANQRLLQKNYLENIRIDTMPESQQRQSEESNEDKRVVKLKSVNIVDSDKLMMEKLVAFIEDNLSNPDLVVEDLAKAVCLGRTAFFNKVKSLVGMSPVEFLRHIRIRHAEELVAKSNEPFSQIAYMVGFSDSRYFGKCFKKQTGLTPSEYREHRNATEQM